MAERKLLTPEQVQARKDADKEAAKKAVKDTSKAFQADLCRIQLALVNT